MKNVLTKVGGLLFAVVLLFSSAPAFAQSNANGFLVSPVREELTIDKGKSETVKMMVENVTNVETTAMAIINDFEPSADESGQPRIILDQNSKASSNSFKSLVSQIPDVKLGPKDKKEVSVKITVPSDAQAGGYYGAIRFASANSGTDKNVALSASVGTIFLVKVNGDITEKLQLEEFTAAKNGSKGRFFVNSGDMTAVTRLKNTGNIHVKPFGRVQLTDRSGKIIQEYELNNTEPRSNVLPNSTRKFEDKLTNSKWIGKYTLTANIGYGTSGSLITAKTSFWVIPSWVLIAGGVLLVVLIVGGYLLYRKISTGTKHKSKVRR